MHREYTIMFGETVYYSPFLLRGKGGRGGIVYLAFGEIILS